MNGHAIKVTDEFLKRNSKHSKERKALNELNQLDIENKDKCTYGKACSYGICSECQVFK